MKLSCLFLAVGVCASLVIPAPAQNPPDKARQVIDAAVAALGGDRFLNMQSRVASGRIYGFFHDQMSGEDVAKVYVEYLPAANGSGLRVRERELLGKKLDYSYLYLSDQGWDVTFRGARPISDEQWERYSRSTENDVLYILRTRLKEPGMQFDYIGSDVYLSRHVEVVDITDAKERTIRVYFDFNTKLPLRETYQWLDPVTRAHDDAETDYDKYRDAGGGVMWPFTIELHRNGYKAFQMFADKVEVNPPLPKGIFDLPSGVKVLKKEN
ncbi:MAG: hypothetical protein JO061_11360 [Acidobacteriaceae bacterium]|nr:hypothetical protein [Acidobacteriaceae bacterium]